MDVMTIEQVIYRLRPGAERSAFIAANDGVDEFLGRQPGFAGRQLAEGPDGTWVDIVWWRDRPSAEAAAAAFSGAPEAAAVSALIDPAGMDFRHLELVRDVPHRQIRAR